MALIHIVDVIDKHQTEVITHFHVAKFINFSNAGLMKQTICGVVHFIYDDIYVKEALLKIASLPN